MKKQSMRNILAILFLIACISATAAQAETITIVGDTWCPYNCGPTSPHPGFMVDIAKKAFARHNIEVEYKAVPWSEAISDTRKGKYTAIIGAATKDAPDFIFPGIPQGWMRNVFYVKKGNPWRYAGMDSLKSVILGLIADYSYDEEMDDYVKKYKLDPERIQMMGGDNALGINLSKLLRGKIGAIIENQYVMQYYLSLNSMEGKVEKAGRRPPSDQDYLFIAFSPKDKSLSHKYADILTQETKEMRKSGELHAILDVYGMEDWEK
jgi:polar amino acid transport system substrate-binding protein